MTASTTATTPGTGPATRVTAAASSAKKRVTSPIGTAIAMVVAALWTLPSFGLLITSFRPEESIKSTGWWTWFTSPEFTLENYRLALTGGSTNLGTYFVNSVVITIPAVVIPIALASLAAYAFAWMSFPGRDTLFVAVFALQIVPIQVTMIPLLTFYTKQLGISQTFWPVWISHTMFGLPLAIYLLHNFMSEIPRELIEAARVDGCGHVKVFFRVMLPLLTPALAAFGIFQFLWVWNDLLVALVFGSSRTVSPLTVRVAELSGTRGTEWHLLSAGAMLSIVVPLIVFVSMQRYFVRGLLAGSVKG